MWRGAWIDLAGLLLMQTWLVDLVDALVSVSGRDHVACARLTLGIREAKADYKELVVWSDGLC